MEKFLKEILTGEEAQAAKKFLTKMSMMAQLGAIFGFLVLLDLLPRFTTAVTLIGLVSFSLMHFLRKWSKG